ncbi:MAG: helix-turn-helix domain-containing protein [Bdellovibrionia bacterium]
MKPRNDGHRSGCPISFTLDILGDKWTLLIIRDLMFKGKQHYGEFLNSEEKIATNILADRLQRLEREEIISSSKAARDQKKIIYQLTDKGIELLPMILEMIQWGAKHDSKTAAPKEFVARLKKDKAGVIEEFKTFLKKGRKK